MGIVSLPSHWNHLSRKLQYPPVTDVISRNQYQELLPCLHFVDITTNDKGNKLGKIIPVTEVVRTKCIKLEREEF